MILVLGGTSDSLHIGKALGEAGLSYVLSVTTEYGRTLSEAYTQNVIMGKLGLSEMTDRIIADHISIIVDATHPYATEVSKTAMEAAEKLGVSYIRYERKSLLEEADYDKIHIVSTIEEACIAASKMGTTIFLGTGSKNLETFWNLLEGKRLIARVLPTSKVLESCERIGFQADQLIGMKGPFTTDMNEALFRAYGCDLMITKESGTEGGFLEKIEACRKLNIPAVVIKRADIAYPSLVSDITELIKQCQQLMN